MHEYMVAEVDLGLPAGQLIGSDAGQAEHCLQLSTVAGAQCREAQLAGVAQKDDPAGHADQITGGGVRRQILMRLPHLAQRVGARAAPPGRARGPRRPLRRAWPGGPGSARGGPSRRCCRSTRSQARRSSPHERYRAAFDVPSAHGRRPADSARHHPSQPAGETGTQIDTHTAAAWTARSRTFGAVAQAYAAHRPDYPDAALDWALAPLAHLTGRDGGTGRDGRTGPALLDLAAGTGKLTASLVGRSDHVIAVEPDPEMLAVLHAEQPG